MTREQKIAIELDKLPPVPVWKERACLIFSHKHRKTIKKQTYAKKTVQKTSKSDVN